MKISFHVRTQCLQTYEKLNLWKDIQSGYRSNFPSLMCLDSILDLGKGSPPDQRLGLAFSLGTCFTIS